MMTLAESCDCWHLKIYACSTHQESSLQIPWHPKCPLKSKKTLRQHDCQGSLHISAAVKSAPKKSSAKESGSSKKTTKLKGLDQHKYVYRTKEGSQVKIFQRYSDHCFLIPGRISIFVCIRPSSDIKGCKAIEHIFCHSLQILAIVEPSKKSGFTVTVSIPAHTSLPDDLSLQW